MMWPSTTTPGQSTYLKRRQVPRVTTSSDTRPCNSGWGGDGEIWRIQVPVIYPLAPSPGMQQAYKHTEKERSIDPNFRVRMPRPPTDLRSLIGHARNYCQPQSWRLQSAHRPQCSPPLYRDQSQPALETRRHIHQIQTPRNVAASSNLRTDRRGQPRTPTLQSVGVAHVSAGHLCASYSTRSGPLYRLVLQLYHAWRITSGARID
ncbi:hypothetical protein BJX62DRAFT_193530 [Aspergillus germanicus]